MSKILLGPEQLATTTAPGLMSAADKTKLDGMTPSSYYVKPANGIPASDIYFGSGLWYNNNGQLIVDPADAAQIKNEVTNVPIPAHQTAAATFYGLARAAGDSTQKASSNAVGVYTDEAKSAIKNMLDIAPMTGATSSAAGTSGLVPAPATTDVDKFLAGDGTYKSGGLPMVVLSYGSSTWNDFINAYNNNVIVYCRASSNSNPATGSQTRMAFMAYVNNATTPTNVEFQYYRSVSSHSATQMGDQVFVYKLDKTSGWSVTTREASIKEVAVASGSKLGVSWSSNKVTLSNTMTADDMPMSSSDATTAKSAIDTLNDKLNTNSGVITVPRTTGNTSSFYKYNKIGNVVTVYIDHHASDAPINAWSTLDFPSLPSGYRPAQDITVPASTDRASSSGMIFSIFPSGVVRLACKYNGMTDSSDIVRSTITFAVPF